MSNISDVRIYQVLIIRLTAASFRGLKTFAGPLGQQPISCMAGGCPQFVACNDHNLLSYPCLKSSDYMFSVQCSSQLHGSEYWMCLLVKLPRLQVYNLLLGLWVSYKYLDALIGRVNDPMFARDHYLALLDQPDIYCWPKWPEKWLKTWNLSSLTGGHTVYIPLTTSWFGSLQYLLAFGSAVKIWGAL